MIQSFILTGFLGVGKTTMLINTVKEHFKEKNVAIIVNEFGDVGIDGNLVSNVHSEVLEVSQGCICCQLNREFEEGVKEIIQKYTPEILFVETSGASEPLPIFQSLQTLPINKQEAIPTFLSLQNHGISVEGVICVIDAKNFDSYKANSTAKAQVGGANIIVLNKVDLVSDDELEALKQEIITYKEEHDIINKLTRKPLFNNCIIQTAQQGVVKKELFDGLYRVDEMIEIALEDKHHDHTAQDAITQKVAYIKEETQFGQIKQLLKALPKSIYRVKGVVKTADIDDPVVINYAFGDASFHELAEHQDKRSVMIFIGESIEEDVIRLSEEFEFLNLPKFRVSK
ncbi:MAG: GTP-binding protein [Campylobacterales bacterium]|nr:GTP-binding protein [Campylobacterales bacterium]